ncbi:hypothetical protein J2S43_001114 [Catenuloplanes nepalensis]|uniref:DUF4192 domain-containing protein n=1 Tax=Catenuloplanes nepalensis TaxID=587533 RepID=A0ABT9MMG6_9ACTN|nr:DUF4192 domain-containing protein [Catenuloplanes nepalensis]MDP9792602.1 hypothetical protein [Catenuloplanes nepalensis]
MSDSMSSYVIRTPADMLGMVPYLLGFHPSDSLVALMLDAGHRARGAARADLGTPADVIIDDLAKAAAYRNADTVIVVGYGPQSARGQIGQVTVALAERIRSVYSLLVADGRYYCLSPHCTCTARTGLPIDPAATAVAALATVDGLTALPSRDAVIAQVQPDPAAQTAISAAMSSPASADRPDRASLQSIQDLRALLDRAETGIRLSDGQVAGLAQALMLPPVRDLAWQATSGLMWQRNLWLDVTRRVPDQYVAAPAALAAWCCWLRGESTLARAAAQRAVAAYPCYTLALLIVAGLEAGLPAWELVGHWPALPADSADGGTQSS